MCTGEFENIFEEPPLTPLVPIIGFLSFIIITLLSIAIRFKKWKHIGKRKNDVVKSIMSLRMTNKPKNHESVNSILLVHAAMIILFGSQFVIQ